MTGDPVETAAPAPNVVEVAAAALWYRRYNDLSSCPYYLGEEGGTCTFSCHDEPACQTCHPGGDGWPTEALRKRYGSLLDGVRIFAEPSGEELLDALTVLEALSEAGWRIVRTKDASAFDPPDDWEPTLDDPPGWDRSGVFYDDDDRPDGCVPLYRITDEWEPACPGDPDPEPRGGAS